MLMNAVLVGAGLAVVAALRYLWRHRHGRLARGVADAAVTYNVLHGQAPPPTTPRPAWLHDASEH